MIGLAASIGCRIFFFDFRDLFLNGAYSFDIPGECFQLILCKGSLICFYGVSQSVSIIAIWIRSILIHHAKHLVPYVFMFCKQLVLLLIQIIQLRLRVACSLCAGFRLGILRLFRVCRLRAACGQ